jgi:hypothetical protein
MRASVGSLSSGRSAAMFSQPQASGPIRTRIPPRNGRVTTAEPSLKSGAGAPGVSNSVHGRAERTQCSRRPARGLSQAACQHRSHSTAHSFAARAAARVAIQIAINDRSFVETAQARRRHDARGTQPLGMTLARVAARVRDLDNGQCHADISGQSAGRSCRRVAERGRRPQSTHEYRITGRY